MGRRKKESLSLTPLLRLFRDALRHWPSMAAQILCTGLYSLALPLFIIFAFTWLEEHGIFVQTGEVVPEAAPVESPEIPEEGSESGGWGGIGETTEAWKESLERKILEFPHAPGLLLAGVLLVLAGFGRAYFVGLVVWKTVRDIRQRLCNHLLTHPVGFFENRRTGDLLSRLLNDVECSRVSINFLMDDAIKAPFLVIIGLTACFFINWQLTLYIGVALPFLAWALTEIARKIRTSSKKGLERLSELTDSMQQIFSGIRVIKAFHAEEREQGEFRKINRSYFRMMMAIVRARATSSLVVDSAVYVGVPLALIVLLDWSGMISAKDLQGIERFAAVLGTMIYPAIRSLPKEYNQLQHAIPGAERIYEIMDTRTMLADAPDAVELTETRGAVEFRDVSFTYGQGPVLNGVTLPPAPGQITAIVGPSGAGKTTLLDLIPRFHDPTAGAVLVDGHDLRRLKRSSLIRHIGVVTQESFLFNIPIRDNIRYGRPDASDEEVIETAKSANVHEVIENLPQGYDTLVGERGTKLSGGERQRVSIARAMLKNPKVLILDEATSELDTESEKKVQEALRHLMKGRTTFVIAHRLSTVQNADRIVVLNRGRVEQIGPHRELIEQDGLYRKLYNMQFSGT